MGELESSRHEETLGRAYDARLMRRLVRYLGPYRAMALGAVGLIVASSVLQLVGPLVTAVTLDLFVAPSDDPSVAARWASLALDRLGLEPSVEEGILGASGIYLGSLVLAFVVLALQGWTMQLMGQLVMMDLRNEIFGHLQTLEVGFFDRQPVGRLITRVTTDVDALNELFTAGLVSIVGDVVLLLGIVLVLFWMDWRLAFVTFAILPFLLVLTLWFKVRARQMYRRVRVEIARINSFLQEHLSGMTVVQLFGRESAMQEQFEAVNDAHRTANVRAIFYYAVYYPAVELITAVGIALVLWYGGGRVVQGVASMGALVAFLQYAQRFYQPVADLSEKYNILQSAMASSERVFRLLDRAPGVVVDAHPHRAEELEGAIAFEGVSFAYQNEEWVLSDVSFRVEPGEQVAIVGHTGAGKSTVANLILRFYDVQRGAVRVDGIDVREWDPQSLRRHTAMVLQDVVLFSGTVASNVTLGEDSITRERVEWALAEVGALDLVRHLPGGLDAPVRERGAGLSVGEKQLLAFARALAFDPRILILDEATSSVDPESERRIQSALERLLVGRTSLVIAHRLSTIERADRIIVLHRGMLREMGTHAELLAQRGIYHRLHLLQYRQAATAASG